MFPSRSFVKRSLSSSIIAACWLSMSLITGCGEAANPMDEKTRIASDAQQDYRQGELQQDELAEWISTWDGKKLYGAFSTIFQNEIKVTDVQQILESAWKKGEVPTLRSMFTLNDASQFVWTDAEGTIGITAVVQEDLITGMRFVPLESYASDQQLSKTINRLPFAGQWLVYWGGNNALLNYHYETVSQRYAYDFVVEKSGYTFEGDPARNESYFAYGQKVLATADGTVVHIENNVSDNEPVGVMNEQQPAGNVVVLEHGNGEFSYYAHLQKGSVPVQVGDQVSAGQWIGNCGNSGNSSEAHIHYQVSNSSDLFASTSIPVQWNRDQVRTTHDADNVNDGVRFVRGDSVSNK